MQITIRKFDKVDIPKKVQWINDPRNNKYLHYDLPLEIEKTEKWYEANKNRMDRYDATILCDDIPVGLIGLLSISDGKAEYYVTLGENEFKGKGVARQASYLLFEFAKEKLGLHSLYLYTEVENIPAQKLFERIGFKKIGIHEKDVYNRDVLVSRYEYAIDLNETGRIPIEG